MLGRRTLKRILVGATVSLFCAGSSTAFAQDYSENAQAWQDDALQPESRVRLLNVKSRVTIDDVQRAHYHVSFPGGPKGEDSYELAFVERNGTATILSEHGTFTTVALTSKNIPHLVNNYLHMGPVVGLMGTRREFTVGKTYDSMESHANGAPLFLVTCDRKETIAGIDGYHLVLKSTESGDAELEMVLSPDYPFPLLIKELTGSNPLLITLVEIRPLDLAMFYR
jgi:hypothetical protein